MSTSSNAPRDPMAQAVISTTLDDLLLPGVVVVLDAHDAEEIGAFEETALTEAEAWEANSDLDAGAVRDGE